MVELRAQTRKDTLSQESQCGIVMWKLISKKLRWCTSKMASWVKVFATKPGNLSLTSVNHVAGENQLLKVILYLYTYYYGRKMPMQTYIQRNKYNF